MEKFKDDEWIRLPPDGEKCPVTGLYRNALADILDERNPLTGEKYVLSLEQRKEGANRGIRMINKPSLLQYLRRKAQAQNGLRWGDHIKNPDGYTVDDVVSNRLVFEDFLGADDCVSDEAWEVGNLSTRALRIQALVGNGALTKVP